MDPHARMALAVDKLAYGYLLDNMDWIEEASREYEDAALDLGKQWREANPEEWELIKERLKTWAKQ